MEFENFVIEMFALSGNGNYLNNFLSNGLFVWYLFQVSKDELKVSATMLLHSTSCKLRIFLLSVIEKTLFFFETKTDMCVLTYYKCNNLLREGTLSFLKDII